MKSVFTSVIASGLIFIASQTFANDIAGAWNVLSEGTDEHDCKQADPGSKQVYIFLISTSKDGVVTVSVQGETNFKKLSGHWNEKDNVVIIEGHSSATFSTPGATSWFKLEKVEEGKMVGIRRYVGGQGNINSPSAPCFADFKVTATKQ